MSTTSTGSTTYFNGQSTYSADLNNTITRAVATATLPITLLQNEQSTLTNQQSEIQTLGADFMAVQSAIDGLNTAAGTSSYAATVDQPTVASATVSTGSLPGTYSLNISSIGSQTNTISSAGSTTVTDPSSQDISTATSFALAIGGTNYTLSPKGNTLDDLVAVINSSGADVQATVVNVGGSASPDYRLSVQSTQYAPDTIQLNAGSTNLLTTLSTGAYVTYQVNGQPSIPVNSTSRSLSISTGLTADVTAIGTANITVAQTSSGVTTALASLVTAYNSAAGDLTKNRGQNGGALVGSSLIGQLQSSLNSIAAYTNGSGGAVSSLADIGLTFSTSGQLQFDQSTFDAVDSTSPTLVNAFLGSETGGGFTQSAYSTLTSLTDDSTGSITLAGNSVGTTITNLTTQISNKQTQVIQLQSTLTAQMESADAAIASLQGQVSEVTDLFSAELQQQRNATG
jgi:flagellar hook-associated protein 2